MDSNRINQDTEPSRPAAVAIGLESSSQSAQIFCLSAVSSEGCIVYTLLNTHTLNELKPYDWTLNWTRQICHAGPVK